MQYEELQQRYGNHVAKRIQTGLMRNEFATVPIEELCIYLERRAEKAALDYRQIMSNPLDRGSLRSEVRQKVWRDAEDLSYLLSIAEDVSSTVRASVTGTVN
jgi:hypothetical protein